VKTASGVRKPRRDTYKQLTLATQLMKGKTEKPLTTLNVVHKTKPLQRVYTVNAL